MNPKYPIYIVSKGRADSRLTSKALEKINCPYYNTNHPYDNMLHSLDFKILSVEYKYRPFSNKYHLKDISLHF